MNWVQYSCELSGKTLLISQICLRADRFIGFAGSKEVVEGQQIRLPPPLPPTSPFAEPMQKVLGDPQSRKTTQRKARKQVKKLS